MDALRIEPFDPQDADEALALVSMWRASFEHGVGVQDPHPIEAQIEFLLTTVVPAHTVQVAWQGGAIVGFVAYNDESVSQLFARVQNIGQGIGTRLLNLAKAHSSGRLWLYTFARNTRARAFYEHHGFVDIAHGFEPSWQLDDVKFEWVRDAAKD